MISLSAGDHDACFLLLLEQAACLVGDVSRFRSSTVLSASLTSLTLFVFHLFITFLGFSFVIIIGLQFAGFTLHHVFLQNRDPTLSANEYLFSAGACALSGGKMAI